MRDDVVELAADPHPLLGDREPGPLLALALQALSALGQDSGLPPLAAEREADSVGGGKHEPGRHGVFGPGLTSEEEDEIAADDGNGAERAGDDRPTPFGMRADGVEDDEQGDPMLERRLVGAGVVDQPDLERNRGEDERKDDGRRPPPPGQWERDQEEEDGVCGPRAGYAVVEEGVSPDLVLRCTRERERQQGVSEIARTRFRPPACAHALTVSRTFANRIRPGDDPKRQESPSRRSLESEFGPTILGPRRPNVESSRSSKEVRKCTTGFCRG
jgi:hypothetical protein